MSYVPKRPQLCNEMEDIFNKDIAEDEFNTVIATASTNTAPSPTGLTFNMIKKWPEEVKKHLYSTLQPMVNEGRPNSMEVEIAVPKV